MRGYAEPIVLECRKANSTACPPSSDTDSVAEYALPFRGESRRYSLPRCTVPRIFLYSPTNRRATSSSASLQRVRLAPMPSEPCIEDRNRYSRAVLRPLSQFGESVTHAIITAGV